MNSTKFLEDYCSDCLEILDLSGNGDGTVDLTVKIKHPFTGFPEYTGFDVKGILIFDGSLERSNDMGVCGLPDPHNISIKELGDAEVLNADGYTPRWSPSYEETGDLPIFNYWEGKYANGVPSGGLNAYINFYTHEERHYFSTTGNATRTYKIWLPPGDQVVAGYAIEACWEPPTTLPVTDPVKDFPHSANQLDAYFLEMVINNGQPITDCDSCCIENCNNIFITMKTWQEDLSVNFGASLDIFNPGGPGVLVDICPDGEDKYPYSEFDSCNFDNGTYRGSLAYTYDDEYGVTHCSWDFFEWTLDDPDN